MLHIIRLLIKFFDPYVEVFFCIYNFFISSECVRRFVAQDVRRRGGARVAEEGDGPAPKSCEA